MTRADYDDFEDDDEEDDDYPAIGEICPDCGSDPCDCDPSAKPHPWSER